MDMNRRFVHLAILILCGQLCFSICSALESETTSPEDVEDYNDSPSDSEEPLDSAYETPSGPGPIISVARKLENAATKSSVSSTTAINAETNDFQDENQNTSCPEVCSCINGATETVNCSSRGLTQIPPLPTNVVHLDLSNNQIVSMPPDAFSRTAHLEHIDLSNNQLKHINADQFAAIRSLHELRLARNPIHLDPQQTFLHLPALQHLDLHACNLSNVYDSTFLNLSALVDLNLGNNSFSVNFNTKPFERLKNLQRLQLSAIPPEDMRELCANLGALDVVYFDRFNFSCYTFASGNAFEESIDRPTTTTKAPIETTTTTTPKTPTKSKPTKGPNPQNSSTENITDPQLPTSNNQTQIPKLNQNNSTTDEQSQSPSRGAVQVSSHTMRHILVGSIAVAIVGLAIGLCCRRDVCGVKTKLCRTSHRGPTATDQVRPAEQVPLKDIEMAEFKRKVDDA